MFQKTLFDIGVLQRIQTTCNTADQLTRQLPTLAPMLKGIGYELALAISYSISPRHTDELYAEEIAAMVAAGPPKRDLTSDMPLVMLINELKRHSRVRYIQVQCGADSISLQNRGATAASRAE